ncbi:MAG: efflux RND transporter permease subunit, partial [Bacteroidales bacterium]
MIRFIIKYRWFIITVCILAGISFIVLIPFSKTDPDIRNYIPGNLLTRVETDSIETEFGFQDMMVILYHDSNSVITKKNLLELKEIEKKLSSINGISSMISPFSIKTIRADSGMLVVERLVNRIPADNKDEQDIASEIYSNSYARNVVFSSDFKTAAITLTLSESSSEAEIMKGIDSVINASGFRNKIMEGGLPAIRKYIIKDVRKDAFFIVPAALLVMLLVLRITMDSWRNVWIPFTVVVLSTGISLGLIPLLGWKLSIISMLVPVILIAVANNYGIYLVNYYNRIADEYQHNKYKILKKVIDSLKVPILFSGFTTIAGILGLLTHSIIPARQVGILASAGVVIVLAMSLLMIPALLIANDFLRPSKAGKSKPSINMELFFSHLSNIIIKHPGKVLVMSIIIITTFASGIIFLKTDTNQEHFFPDGHRLRKASDIINSSFGGSQTISVMITGDIKDPEVMNGIDKMTRRIESTDGVGKVFSISQAVREMTKALYDSNEKGYDEIPNSREAIAQMFELYYMSGDAEDFKQLLNPENTRAHILIRLSEPDDEIIRRVAGIINEEGKKIPAKINTGGYALIMYEFTHLLIKGQVLSLVFAIVTVFILLAIAFRSIKGGLSGSIPLVGSIIMLFGFMGFSGIAIDPATALLSSVMIGVGVDFTIQYLLRFNREYQVYRDYSTATLKSMQIIGRSIVINAMTVMAGFSALFFSGFTSIRFFGYLVIISIGSCLAGSLFVIPA